MYGMLFVGNQYLIFLPNKDFQTFIRPHHDFGDILYAEA